MNLQPLASTFGRDDTEHHEVMDEGLPRVPQLLLLNPRWDSTRITHCASSNLGPLTPRRIKGANTWMNWSLLRYFSIKYSKEIKICNICSSCLISKFQLETRDFFYFFNWKVILQLKLLVGNNISLKIKPLKCENNVKKSHNVMGNALGNMIWGGGGRESLEYKLSFIHSCIQDRPTKGGLETEGNSITKAPLSQVDTIKEGPTHKCILKRRDLQEGNFENMRKLYYRDTTITPGCWNHQTHTSGLSYKY